MPVSKADRIIIDQDFVPKNAEDVFYKYKAEIIEALRQNLIEKDKDQPGSLIQSIDVRVEHLGGRLVFTLEMEDYWKYVDQGRKPGSKMPPQKAILEFIKVRGIKPTVKKVTGIKNKKIKKGLKQINRDKALKQVAYLIQRSIKKKGIKPTHFFSEVVNDDLKNKMINDLKIALGKDIEVDIKASFK